MNALINHLQLDNDLRLRVTLYLQKHSAIIHCLCLICRKCGFNVLKYCSDMMRLAVCMEYACRYTQCFYREKGISECVFYDTMQDIAIWCANNQNLGLKNYNWIKNHLNGELFRLGRLQYQLFTCSSPSLDYSALPFKKNEHMIYIHIPQGEKLLYCECTASLSSANRFFETYFSQHSFRYYFSESWLLFEGNGNFMDSKSNIMQFQSLFDIVGSIDNDSQAIERIFGERRQRLSDYPENTSLQRRAKAYMLAGNQLGAGIGIIDKSKYSENNDSC